jgi:hypothetical protein
MSPCITYICIHVVILPVKIKELHPVITKPPISNNPWKERKYNQQKFDSKDVGISVTTRRPAGAGLRTDQILKTDSETDIPPPETGVDRFGFQSLLRWRTACYFSSMSAGAAHFTADATDTCVISAKSAPKHDFSPLRTNR